MTRLFSVLLGLSLLVAPAQSSNVDLWASHNETARHSSPPNGERWDGRFMAPGLKGFAHVLVSDGTNVYVGGDFVGGHPQPDANGVVRWNGSYYEPLGKGVNGTVYAVAVVGTDVYVGGDFTEATQTDDTVLSVRHLARWDGSEWHSVGSGVDAPVRALAHYDGVLYVGGEFVEAGGDASIEYLAQYDGGWTETIAGGLSGPVRALEPVGGDLIVGGSFIQVNVDGSAEDVRNVIRWDGSTYERLGLGCAGTVNAVTTDGTDLYVGGDFPACFNDDNGSLDAVGSANHVARWDEDAGTWVGLGQGTDGRVQALAYNHGSIYVGGKFSDVTQSWGFSLTAKHIARWSGTAWQQVGSAGFEMGLFSFRNIPELQVHALEAHGPVVMAGVENGTIENPDGSKVLGGFFGGGDWKNTVLRWNDSYWSSLGQGMRNASAATVEAVARVGTDVYAGGRFGTAGGVNTGTIARWDGQRWHRVGGGLDGIVLAMAEHEGDLYVGGEFTVAYQSDGTEVVVNHIARWDGTRWHAMGSGFDRYIYEVAVGCRGQVYVAGPFSQTGDGMRLSDIAGWNARYGRWQSLQTGIGLTTQQRVDILTTCSGAFVGGGLTGASNVKAPGFGGLVDIARIAAIGGPAEGVRSEGFIYWSGLSWRAKTPNRDIRAMALTVTNGLIAGGNGTSGSSVKLTNRFGSWRDLGSLEGSVDVLHDVAGVHYAGGDFTVSGAYEGLVRWGGDASTPGRWATPLEGTNNSVKAIDSYKQTVYFGGEFSRAGGQPASNFAILYSGNGTLADADGDSIPDVQEDANGDGDLSNDDADGDGIPNYQDADSDNDGRPDDVEAGDQDLFTIAASSDANGIPDFLDPDDDGDGIATDTERADAIRHGNDPDGDGLLSFLDADADNDGVDDGDEGRGDRDGDGLPDYLDADMAVDQFRLLAGDPDPQDRYWNGVSFDYDELAEDDDLTVIRVAGVPSGTLPNGDGNALDYFWTVERAGTGTFSAEVCFYILDRINDVDPALLTLYKRENDTAPWEELTTTLKPNDTNPHQICATGISRYSTFAVAASQSALPVELSGFDAQRNGATVRLAWQTASETNNAGFHLERAVDGGGFTEIGFVGGAGTTERPQSYRFTDARLPFAADTLTYRLRQVDLDGTTAVSDPVVVAFGTPDRLELLAPYPNPARGAATLRYALPGAADVQIEVYNVLGQRVAMIATGRQEAGRVEQRLDTSRWPSGLYFVRLVTDGAVRTERLTVVR
jgi:hypothetical protein